MTNRISTRRMFVLGFFLYFFSLVQEDLLLIRMKSCIIKSKREREQTREKYFLSLSPSLFFFFSFSFFSIWWWTEPIRIERCFNDVVWHTHTHTHMMECYSFFFSHICYFQLVKKNRTNQKLKKNKFSNHK